MENYIFGQAVEIPKNSEHRFQHPPVGRILEWQQICFPVYTVSCTAVLQPTSPYGQPCFWHTINGAESQPWCNPALLCIRSDACGGHRTDAGPGAKLKLPHSASDTDYPKLHGKLFSRIKLLKKHVIAGLYLLYSNAIYFIFVFTYWQLLLFWVNVQNRA